MAANALSKAEGGWHCPQFGAQPLDQAKLLLAKYLEGALGVYAEGALVNLAQTSLHHARSVLNSKGPIIF